MAIGRMMLISMGTRNWRAIISVASRILSRVIVGSSKCHGVMRLIHLRIRTVDMIGFVAWSIRNVRILTTRHLTRVRVYERSYEMFLFWDSSVAVGYMWRMVKVHGQRQLPVLNRVLTMEPFSQSVR